MNQDPDPDFYKGENDWLPLKRNMKTATKPMHAREQKVGDALSSQQRWARSRVPQTG
jgi:hypothetical protein